MPMWTKISFQDSNSPLMEHLSFFHDHSMIILTFITILLMYLISISVLSKYYNRFFLEAQEIELFWTSMPALMLMFIAIPSLKTLYMMEESMKPALSIKTMGFQWHWGYEYSELSKLKFNSMVTKNNNLRLMESSNHLIIPIKTPTRMLVTSKDVIHSWTIPSLGVKVDAMPGRINQMFIMINRPSIMVGQCSEICGAGHSFMPITMESPTMNMFKKII